MNSINANKRYMDTEATIKLSRFDASKDLKRSSCTSLDEHILRWSNVRTEFERDGFVTLNGAAQAFLLLSSLNLSQQELTAFCTVQPLTATPTVDRVCAVVQQVCIVPSHRNRKL